MATGKKPDDTDKPSGSGAGDDQFRDPALDAKRDRLGAAIAAKQAERAAQVAKESGAPKTDGMAGMAYALRLSSEFIAGVIVGAVIGYTIDTLAGTSPWGLIIFLLLGFVAGILNVLRSAGLIAPSESRKGRANAVPAAAAPAAADPKDDEEED